MSGGGGARNRKQIGKSINVMKSRVSRGERGKRQIFCFFVCLFVEPSPSR